MSAMMQIHSMIKIISDLEARRDLVVGNIEKSKLLIDRCVEFLSILETLEKGVNISPSVELCLNKLKEVITRSLQLIDNFCQPGWLRLIINISNANKYNEEFEYLNDSLSECRSDLHFGLDVAARIRQEDLAAKAQDDHKLLAKIYEMLSINNIEYSASLTLTPKGSGKISSQNLLEEAVERFQREIPQYNHIIEETEIFLDTIYAADIDLDNDRDFFDAPCDELPCQPPCQLPYQPLYKPRGNDYVDSSEVEALHNLPLYKRSILTQVIKGAQIMREQLRDSQNLGLWNPKAEDVLGKGSFGIVYKGCYAGKLVAVKVIQGFSGGIPPSELKKIEREIFILAKCHHPNIIHFLGCDMIEGLLLTGLAVTNLFSMVYGMYSEDYALSVITSELKICWLRDIASGLQYLHFFDIIHRDLKPHNILLCVDSNLNDSSLHGNSPRLIAKITDFGVSSVAGLSSTRRSTTAGSAVGTTSYKAPELFNRKVPLKQRYSKAIDIYAFGVLANELFTGEVPWTDCNAEDIAFEVRDGGRPTLFIPKNPMEEKILDLIGNNTEECFAEDRNKRPDAGELLRRLPNVVCIAPSESSTHDNRPHRSVSESVHYISSKGRSNLSSKSSITQPLKRSATDPNSSQSFGNTSTSVVSISVNSTSLTSNSKTVVTAMEKTKYITAAQGGNIDTILSLLDTTDISIETADKDGMTALHWMASYGQVNAIENLLNRGANLHAKNRDGVTALIMASELEETDTALLLLDRGSDVNATDKYGWTPLMKACWSGKVEVAQLLIERGAIIDAKFMGKTSLMYASWGGHVACVELLIDSGADIQSKDFYEETALEYAIKYDKDKVAEVLRSRGATA